MVKKVDSEIRKRAVLTVTINRYIKNAMPVSSEDIAAGFDLSSATIRNIFKELEDEGYLTHPYTSGGRIPTNRGYRYYVDFLIYQMELLDEEKERIGNEYKKQIRKIEDLLERTSELLASVTHHASIVSFLGNRDRLLYKGISFVLEQPEFRESERIRCLIKVIEDKQRLFDIINRDFDDRIRVYIGDELEYPEITNCSLVVSKYNANKKPAGKIAVLGPMRMEYTHIIPALEYVSDVLTGVLDGIPEDIF